MTLANTYASQYDSPVSTKQAKDISEASEPAEFRFPSPGVPGLDVGVLSSGLADRVVSNLSTFLQGHLSGDPSGGRGSDTLVRGSRGPVSRYHNINAIMAD